MNSINKSEHYQSNELKEIEVHSSHKPISIPDDSIFEMMSYLETTDLCKCRIVSKKWNSLAMLHDNSKQWERLYVKKFGDFSYEAHNLSWREGVVEMNRSIANNSMKVEISKLCIERFLPEDGSSFSIMENVVGSIKDCLGRVVPESFLPIVNESYRDRSCRILQRNVKLSCAYQLIGLFSICVGWVLSVAMVTLGCSKYEKIGTCFTSAINNRSLIIVPVIVSQIFFVSMLALHAILKTCIKKVDD